MRIITDYTTRQFLRADLKLYRVDGTCMPLHEGQILWD